VWYYNELASSLLEDAAGPASEEEAGRGKHHN